MLVKSYTYDLFFLKVKMLYLETSNWTQSINQCHPINVFPFSYSACIMNALHKSSIKTNCPRPLFMFRLQKHLELSNSVKLSTSSSNVTCQTPRDGCFFLNLSFYFFFFMPFPIYICTYSVID